MWNQSNEFANGFLHATRQCVASTQGCQPPVTSHSARPTSLFPVIMKNDSIGTYQLNLSFSPIPIMCHTAFIPLLLSHFPSFLSSPFHSYIPFLTTFLLLLFPSFSPSSFPPCPPYASGVFSSSVSSVFSLAFRCDERVRGEEQ